MDTPVPAKLAIPPDNQLYIKHAEQSRTAYNERTEMFKSIRKATNKVEWMWFWLTRYMVVARGRVHWAKTEAEALEWMACYPADALMMYGKRGKLIGARHM